MMKSRLLATFASACALLIFQATSANAQTVKPAPAQAPASSARPAGLRTWQASLTGGFIFDSNQEPSGTTYDHETFKSPSGNLAMHYAFFAHKRFNMLVGVELAATKSISEASSSLATSQFVTSSVDAGPTIGIAWYPGGPGSEFQFQGNLGITGNISYTRQLKSPGFTADLDRSDTDFFPRANLLLNILGVYSVSDDWRLITGLKFLTPQQSFHFGVGYAF